MVIHSRASDGRSASQCPLGVQAVWKRARAEDAQNGFLCRRLSVEVASNICSRTGRIEIVLLYENSTAEFSHSLDPERTSVGLLLLHEALFSHAADAISILVSEN